MKNTLKEQAIVAKRIFTEGYLQELLILREYLVNDESDLRDAVELGNLLNTLLGRYKTGIAVAVLQDIVVQLLTRHPLFNNKPIDDKIKFN